MTLPSRDQSPDEHSESDTVLGLPAPAKDSRVILGGYKVTTIQQVLRFPEANHIKMEYEHSASFEITDDTRFFERQYGWTGRGVQSPPKIEVWLDDRQVGARRHGPIFYYGNADAFLVDLGEVAHRGSNLTVRTSLTLVDEAGTFQPYLSRRCEDGLRELSLIVEFRHPPAQVDYVYIQDDGVADTPKSVSAVDSDFGLTRFSVNIESPKQGAHRLLWQ